MNLNIHGCEKAENSHHESAHLADLSERECDVEEHDDVAEGDGDDVAARLALKLVFDRTLRVESDLQK